MTMTKVKYLCDHSILNIKIGHTHKNIVYHYI